MQTILKVNTHQREELVDITSGVQDILDFSGGKNGVVSIFVQGATAAIMIQENWDPSVPTDVVEFLRRLIPRGKWLHDQQDGNGDAHLKAGLIGPSETIPFQNGKMLLGTWQNIFLCEFDGPRQGRKIIVSVLHSGNS